MDPARGNGGGDLGGDGAEFPARLRLEVVIPVFNEADCLEELIRRLHLLRERLAPVETSFIFVDDGSRDGSPRILEAHAARHPFFKVIRFSRNFGHQFAVTAGLDRCSADYVAIIDADLQDRPELIEEMLRVAREGHDIVYGQRIARHGETPFKRLSASLFYRALSRLCDVEIPRDTGDFRLLSRRALRALQGMRERHRFLRGMVPWVGFQSVPFPYERDARFAGETKYPLRKMLRFALDAIFSFSNTPLRLASYSGLIIVLLGVLGSMVVLYLKFFTDLNVPGVTAIILAIVIMGGIQILMLGTIGEYLGRVFEEIKGRPLYIVERTLNLDRAPNLEAGREEEAPSEAGAAPGAGRWRGGVDGPIELEHGLGAQAPDGRAPRGKDLQ